MTDILSPRTPASSALPPAPSKAEVQAVIPAHCFEKKLSTSMRYAVTSLVLMLVPVVLAYLFLPLTWAWTPAWIAYAIVTGTLSNGVWVIAHECGHGAFANNKKVQDAVGFVFHSLLLVPYFSWQRSHAIHHAKTNHLVDGETHVPARVDTPAGARTLAVRRRLGTPIHAALGAFARLVFGWPVYLLTGATGGLERGRTNHFWPYAPFSKALFPARWAGKVLASAAGVLTVLALLGLWAFSAGSVMPVVALYLGPYLVGNMWLVAYTWLHHTGADIPHYEGDDWSYVRGAFCSIDRPYGRFFDRIHHHIGSTHAAHHLFARIPHYHAVEATQAIKTAFPDFYRFDPTPVPVALWRASKECVVVAPTDSGWRYVDASPAEAA